MPSSRFDSRRRRSLLRLILSSRRRDSAPTSRRPRLCCAAAVEAGHFSVTLLDGVTGSGKTEVYFEAVAAALSARQAGADPSAGDRADPAFLERFAEPLRRPAGGVALRSAAAAAGTGLAPGRRRPRAGGGRRALGSVPAVRRARPDRRRRRARSGLQAGGACLLQRPRHGGGARHTSPASRWCCRRRRRRSKARSTPGWGGYRTTVLPARFAAAALPEVRAIDMRRAPPGRGRFLSPPLIAAIAETLGRGEQALLFLNRRGYAPLTLCRACGHRFQCADCVELAGRASLPRPAGLPPLRPSRAEARGVPRMRHLRPSGCLRAGRRTHRRRGGRGLSRGAHHRAVVRSRWAASGG